MKKAFSFFSNTVEEFEPFVKAKTFYWPRSIATKTKYQRENNVDSIQENIGDTVYIIAGARVKNNIKDQDLKNRITGFPMVTHKGVVKEIFNYPVLGYRYTHGRNPDSSFMLPFDFLEEFTKLDVYLGKQFLQENKEELKIAIQLGKIIKKLLENDEIEFKRAYYKNNSIFIQNDTLNSLFKLDHELLDFTYQQADVNDRLTYREMPSKQSLLKIVEECNKIGLDGESLIKKLRTWRGREFVKVAIEDEVFTEIEGKLQEGVSTRLILKEDDSDGLLTDIMHKIDIDTRFASNQEEVLNMQLPKNQILYGPPGTGKTYSVVRKALEIVAPKLFDEIASNEEQNPEISYRDQWMDAYKHYTENKQIQFCTFHQSYTYEDFVEGLRSDENGKFVPTNGIFLDICESASLSKKQVAKYEFDPEKIKFYKMSLGDSTVGTDIYEYCIEKNVLALGYGGNVDYTDCKDRTGIRERIVAEYDGNDNHDVVLRFMDYFKLRLKVDDIVLVSDGNHKIRAVGRVTGQYEYNPNAEINYNHFRSIEWLYSGLSLSVGQFLNEKVLSQQSIYQFDKADLNLEFIKELLSKNEENVDIDPRKFVLIMDEINRGNISRIFGELITLIEEDKRLGEENEVVVKLPYSRKTIGVPSNLYLIGTMNTADRSITLMDTALRRRFDFIEMLPEISLLPEDVDGINVKKLVETINHRIEYLYDRDHTIGHAFFLGDNLSDQKLIDIMQKKVIPLLQEYFYDEWDKIELVLGGAANNNDNYSNFFIRKEILSPTKIFINLKSNNYLEEQVKYSFVSKPTKQALINIYEGQNGK
ncbi:AAA family ATPase [Niallia taxi]|uniref:AAA family ATPase n=1 Tax=Niallia taxi TaxID=2499688 RepID=UPI0015F56D99|nr:AAA family ATPase [Niallia taxi]